MKTLICGTDWSEEALQVDKSRGRTGGRQGPYLLVSVPMERPSQEEVEISRVWEWSEVVEVREKYLKSALCKDLRRDRRMPAARAPAAG